jgi:cell division protein YceG involved in septum cleavage
VLTRHITTQEVIVVIVIVIVILILYYYYYYYYQDMADPLTGREHGQLNINHTHHTPIEEHNQRTVTHTHVVSKVLGICTIYILSC